MSQSTEPPSFASLFSDAQRDRLYTHQLLREEPWKLSPASFYQTSIFDSENESVQIYDQLHKNGVISHDGEIAQGRIGDLPTGLPHRGLEQIRDLIIWWSGQSARLKVLCREQKQLQDRVQEDPESYHHLLDMVKARITDVPSHQNPSEEQHLHDLVQRVLDGEHLQAPKYDEQEAGHHDISDKKDPAMATDERSSVDAQATSSRDALDTSKRSLLDRFLHLNKAPAKKRESIADSGPLIFKYDPRTGRDILVRNPHWPNEDTWQREQRSEGQWAMGGMAGQQNVDFGGTIQ